MAKIGGEASAIPEYKIRRVKPRAKSNMPRYSTANFKSNMPIVSPKKSLMAEQLLQEAAKKNPAVQAMLNGLKKLVPGLNVSALMLDSSRIEAPVIADPKDTEAVAQFLFDNGGRWPDEGIGSFKEGYKGDREGILNLYQAMVQQAAHDQMAESDMKTQEKYQLYDPDERKSLADKRATFLKNL